MADIMQRRNSPLIKTVFVVAGLGSIVYLIYLNHDVNTKLKNTDDRAERYRRSHESLSAQLQDLSAAMAAKESSERKSITDKEEMEKRLSAKAKESTLLKSQYDDVRSDLDKLEAEKSKVELDLESLRVENKREYEQMKTQKDFEISKLKDSVANQSKHIEKLTRDIQTIVNQNKNLQVVKDTALSNISKLHQDLIRVKAMSIAANTSVTNLQNNNKELQFAPHAQGQPLGNLAIQGGQQPQGGALVMNQNQKQNGPPWGGALNPNNLGAGAVNVQIPGVIGQNNAGLIKQEGDIPQKKAEEGDDVNKPVIPDVIDQGNGQAFQIKPANLGGERKVGYNHEGDSEDENIKDVDNKVAAGEHKEEDNALHQVQPPNLLPIDNDGIRHRNPHDKMFANRGRDDFGDVDPIDQDGHDNSIKHQGPNVLQVQEPDLGRNPDKEGHNGLEEDEDEDRDENMEEQEEGFHANQFMRNAHLNKQFAPPAEHNVDEDLQMNVRRQHGQEV